MFCPRCATENALEQGYCRQCGQSLSDVRMALEGSATESLRKLQAGAKLMNGGIATLISFILIALLLSVLGIALGNPVLSSIGMLNVLLGALIGFPLVFVGKANVKRATRLLSGTQHQISRRTAGSVHRPGDLLTTDLEKGTHSVSAPGSVTEHTTLELHEPRSAVIRQDQTD